MTHHPRTQAVDGGTALRGCSADRCLVSPSPELLAKLRAETKTVRENASPMLRSLISLRPKRPLGFNDGLIIPAEELPVGASSRDAAHLAALRAPLRGQVRVVVVLVDFPDRAMTRTRRQFEELFFSTRTIPSGSAREYFQEVSDGLIDLAGEVVGPLRLHRSLADYAHGDSGIGLAAPNAQTMAYDAAVLANAAIDFSPYDNDGNGYVDAFIVVHAGPGGEITGSVDDIWSHKWVLRDGSFVADASRIYGYLTVPEDAKIGVCCHELGHLLFGWPDLYDTDYTSSGIGDWCLMAGGSWNGGGDVPAHPSAWCKASQGWVQTIVQTTNAKVTLPDVKACRAVHRLWTDGRLGSEYFLLENRQRTGFDRGLPGEGLLVWHIDDGVDGNEDEHRAQVALLQADGSRDLERGANQGDAADPYPGARNILACNSKTKPNTRSHAGANSYVTLSRISGAGPTMSAQLGVRRAGSAPIRPSARVDGVTIDGHARAPTAATGALDLRVAELEARIRDLESTLAGPLSGSRPAIAPARADEADGVPEAILARTG